MAEIAKYEANPATGRLYRGFSGPLQIKVPAGTIIDDSGNESEELIVDLGTIDAIKPEIIYRYSEADIDHTNKTAKVVFSITDRCFDENNSSLAVGDLTIKVDPGTAQEVNLSEVSTVTKTLTETAKIVLNTQTGLTTSKPADYTLGENESIIGKTYELLLEHLEQLDAEGYGDGFTYSGVISVAIPSGKVHDTSGSSNVAKTITVGIKEPEGTGDAEIVDVVDPIWEIGTKTVTTDASGVTSAQIELIAKDKYFSKIVPTTTDALKNLIKVYVAGEDKASELNITLTGPTNVTNGKKYVFTLSNFEETYEEFLAQRALYAADPATGRLYREFSGDVQVEIPAGTIQDTSGNVNKVTTVDLGTIDTLKPEVVKVSSTNDTTNKTQTIVFDITDKFMASSAITTTDTSKIHVYVDDQEVTNITKTITNIQELRTTIGTNTNQLVGYRYTLQLSDFEKLRNSNEYVDWSGTVSIKVDADTATDASGTGNAVTTMVGEFADFIKPDIEYIHQSSDINGETKTYTMTFSITDKYYSRGSLTVDDITSGALEILMKDQLGNEYNLKDEDVTLSLIATPITVPSMKKTTNIANKTVETVTNALIGHEYTLTISDLENSELAQGGFSGVVTVAINANKVIDISNNGNDAKTLTSGISFEGRTDSGTAVPVDVVDPIIKKVEASAYAFKPTDKTKSIATIKLNAIDTYFTTGTTADASKIDSNEIEVYVNGTKTTAITPTISSATAITAVTGGNTVQYGVEQTITLEGWAQDANQVKIKILEDSIIDKYGNGNKATELIVYNCIKSTQEETDADSPFLGETSLKREDVEHVIFAESLADSTAAGVQKVWDVSAQQDGSIKAWTSQTSAPYTIYIGSDHEIFANPNSSYLFAHIGYGSSCTSTTAVTNLNLFNTSSATNMTGMFWFFGYRAMTSLDLGTMDTTNVTNMREMFNGCGYKQMTTFSLGTNFNTANVEDMSWMFSYLGYTKLTTLDLGDLFNTGKVKDMSYMFMNTGYTAMTGITMGDTFNTISVTDMSYMFKNFGYTALTQLDLGSRFNTSSVTNMQNMFEATGYTAMTSLEIGDNFNTGNVTNMESMFASCGYTAMTSLDLSSGTAATNTTQFNTSSVTTMKHMFLSCGYTAMTTLSLGNNFDTSSVTLMQVMFQNCGTTKMTGLNLGSKFDTSNVTNMSYMFNWCGANSMQTLILGDKFNTSGVTQMQYMFNYCGRYALTSLDLGNLFYTNNVTNMYAMFNRCGETTMTSLDLGPAFTNIPSGTGTDVDGNEVSAYGGLFGLDGGSAGASGCTIYASESIYKNKNAFKLNSTDTATTVSYTRGTINPIYKPEWTVTSAIDTTNKELDIIIKGKAAKTQTIDSNVAINYSSNVTGALELGDIKVFIDGSDVTSNITDATKKPDGSITPTGTTTGAEVTYTLTLSDFEETVRQTGKSFKEWSGNISIKIAGRGEATSTYTANVLKDNYGNQSMMATDETGTWVDIEFKDGEVVRNTNGKMFTDFVKPEFTYRSTNTTIDHTNKNVTVTFDVVDEFYSSATIDSGDITVVIDADATANANVTKTINKTAKLVINTSTGVITSKATNYTVGTGERLVGETFALVIGGLEQTDANGLGDGYLYSGPVNITFGSGVATDLSGNSNNSKTITIGIDEPEGTGSAEIVDVVDPVWSIGTTDLNSGTIKLRVEDKYLDATESQFNLQTGDILVYINGVLDGDTNGNGQIDSGETPKVVQTISGPTQIVPNQEYEYTLTLSGVTSGEDNYIAFTPDNATTDGLVPDTTVVGGTAEYQDENGGEITIKLLDGEVVDQYGNESKETELNIGEFDKTPPEVYQIQTTQDSTAGAEKETIVFNVTDKNYYPTDLVETSELTIWMDGVQLTTINIDSLTHKEIKKEVTGDGVSDIVGHQYTLVVSNIVESAKQAGKDYLEYSGTLQVKINANASRDKAGNTLRETTTTLSDYLDYIEPEIQYTHSSSDISYGTNSYTMTFRIIDKYYSTGTLTASDITSGALQIKMADKLGHEFVLNNEDVTIELTSEEVRIPTTGTVNVTNASSGAIEAINNHLIGHEYTLTFTDLEKLVIESGYDTANYSGVISVAIPANEVRDRENNGNIAKTLTSGISFDDGIESGSQTVVDVVDPLLEKVSSSANAIDPANTSSSTAQITIRATDTYFTTGTTADNSKIDSDEVEVYVNGEKTTAITPTISTATAKTKSVVINGTTTTPQYGIEQTITLTGWAQNANQVKIKILEDAIVDQSGNGNKETELILYNVLEVTNAENAATHGFLDGNGASATGIARQDIEKVIFSSNMNGAIASGVYKVWDVSAQNDGSIKAWTTQTSAPYTVYIGSDWEIFANQDSSRLFHYIGYSTNCNDTEIIENIESLNTSGVTNMYQMFRYSGYNAMTELDLGDNFDTRNVINMNYMFNYCGWKAMETLNLGTQFNSSKAISMIGMFNECGYTAMEKLDLRNSKSSSGATIAINFDTSLVGDMAEMFYKCGYTAMTAIDFGDQFNTSNVTKMKDMFAYCGFTAMQSLNLGAEGITFNTGKVTNMWQMFYNCGYTAMSSLDLGDLFDTRQVTDMHNMFRECGYKELLSLDLSSGTTAENTTQFNTSNVRDMVQTFQYLGNDKMATLKLGHNFNTGNVTNMQGLFANCGYTKMTSLDLGDQFYTTNATNMQWMFTNTGAMSMTVLDLGPAFTKISTSNTSMFTNCGTSELVIYTPEAVYTDRDSFKLNN